MKANLNSLKQLQVLFLFKRVIHKVVGTLPKVFSQRRLPKWQFKSQGATSQMCDLPSGNFQRLGYVLWGASGLKSAASINAVGKVHNTVLNVVNNVVCLLVHPVFVYGCGSSC